MKFHIPMPTLISGLLSNSLHPCKWFGFISLIDVQVLISAHVPYGVGALGDYIHMYQPYNAKFVSLVKEYSDVIIGSFFGHEHNDAFKVVYNDGMYLHGRFRGCNFILQCKIYCTGW